MRRGLRIGLIRESSVSNQPATRGELFAVWMKRDFDCNSARFTAVELEGCEEIHIFDGRYVPAGKQSEPRFGECFQAHDPRQNWRAIDLMVVEEGLNFRVKYRVDFQRRENSCACYFAKHRAVRQFAAGAFQAARFVPLFEQHAQALSNYDFAASSAGDEFAANQWDPGFGRQHVYTSGRHDFGNRAASRHPYDVPCGPVDRNRARSWESRSETRSDLAQQIVGGTVIGLSGITEAPGNGTESDCSQEWHIADRMQQVEESVGFDVEHEIEFTWLFFCQRATAVEPGAMEQDIDAPASLADLRNDLGHGFGVGEINREVMGGTPGHSDLLDRIESGMGALQCRQFLFHQSRRGALPASLNAGKKIALQSILI